MNVFEKLKTDRKFLIIVIILVVLTFIIPYVIIPGLIAWLLLRWFYKKSKFSRKFKVASSILVVGLVALFIGWITVRYTQDPEPQLSIVEPSTTSTIQTNQITIKGTYSPADRTIEINGQIVPSKDGSFQTTYQLKKGENKIDVQAGQWKWAHVYLTVTRELTDTEKAALAKAAATSTPIPTQTPTTKPYTTPISTPNLQITTKANASPSTIGVGTVQITTAVTINKGLNALVDVEVQDQSGNKVFQNVYDNQTFSANIPQNYTSTWNNPPSTQAGVYIIKIGIFGPNWNGLLYWSSNASVVTITQASSPPTATPAPLTYDVNGFPDNATAVVVSDLIKTPSAYDNKKIVVTCTVANFVRDYTGDASGFNCSDPNDFSSIIQINAGFDLTKVNQGDTVRVYGLGNGIGTGKNAFGADVTEPLVLGLYVNDLTSGYNDAK